ESSFTGHLEILNLCQFQLYKSATNFTITECKSLQTFQKLRDSFDKSMVALLLLEIFQKCTGEQDQGEALFDLLKETLVRLNISSKSFIIMESFKIKLLALVGVMPDL